MFLDEEEVEQCAAGTNDQNEDVHRVPGDLRMPSLDTQPAGIAPTQLPNHAVVTVERSHPCKFPINAPHLKRANLAQVKRDEGTKEGATAPLGGRAKRKPKSV